ncbi:MAG: orotate phosphoribosyltransferase [Myxococcales bacterium]|nr:orotate phosphoribosyltransferase [Myxococcota bacterium]MDW8283611.1 orotate phosphoribosyltransferase [Myxococcales bacterium]
MERDLGWFREPGAAMLRRRLVELLRLRSYQEREVVLSSGRRSTFYIDCKPAVLTAEGHFLCGHLVLHLLRQVAPEVQAVGGLSVGADPIASATSTLSFLGGWPLAAFYVRKEPKAHGTGQWIEGAVAPGMPVAIVEDVVTTGASTLKAIERARQHGLSVRHVVALCDREEGGREAIEAVVPMTALTCRTEIVS